VIDRIARDQLSEEVRHFVAGLSDNFEFDDAVWSLRTKDIGVIRVREAMWHVYDDISRHKLKGKRGLSEKEREVVSRFVVFLKSDNEYRWPTRLSSNPFLRLLLGVTTLGFGLRYLDKKWEANGSPDVWPFLTVEEFNEAKRNPVYLATGT